FDRPGSEPRVRAPSAELSFVVPTEGENRPGVAVEIQGMLRPSSDIPRTRGDADGRVGIRLRSITKLPPKILPPGIDAVGQRDRMVGTRDNLLNLTRDRDLLRRRGGSAPASIAELPSRT